MQASVKAPTKIEVRTSSPITSDVTYYIRCRRGASTLWPWRYRDGFNPLTAELLVLDEHGVCVIAELTGIRGFDEGMGKKWPNMGFKRTANLVFGPRGTNGKLKRLDTDLALQEAVKGPPPTYPSRRVLGRRLRL